MEVKKCCEASLLLLVLILASQEMLCQGQERLCGSQSNIYRGICRNVTCRVVCQSEGFKNGFCEMKWFFFLNRKCICQKPCLADMQKGDAQGPAPGNRASLRVSAGKS